MTRRHSSHRTRHPTRGHVPPRERSSSAAGDSTIYLGLLVIGLAVSCGAWLLLHETPWAWRAIVVGYVALMAWFMTTAALAAYRGRARPRWMQALARVPLRFVGYGTRGGKPIEACHTEPAARTAILVAAVASAIVVAALVLLFVLPAIE